MFILLDSAYHLIHMSPQMVNDLLVDAFEMLTNHALISYSMDQSAKLLKI